MVPMPALRWMVVMLFPVALWGCAAPGPHGAAPPMAGDGALLGSPAAAPPPQWRGPYRGSGKRGWVVSGGAGFTVSPGALLLSGEALYTLDVDLKRGPLPGVLSVGPLLQLGFTGNVFLFAPSANARYTVDVPHRPQLKPFAEAGVGFLISKEKNHGTFGSGLFLIGGGVDYMIRENIGVGGKSYLNFAPGPGQDFFASFLGGVSFHY